VRKKVKKINKKHFVELGSFRIHHKVLFTCVGVVGVILVWRGIWSLFDQTPIVSNPIVSLLLGLLLVLFSGIFFKLI